MIRTYEQIKKIWGDSYYCNINIPLSYGRRWMFIGGAKGIGKTYGVQKLLLEDAIKNNKQFIYIVRTKVEIEDNVFSKAWMKVAFNEFPEHNIQVYKKNTMILKAPNKNEDDRVLGYCLNLTTASKHKLTSYPFVYWFYMDEYCLDPDDWYMYINGMREPNKLLLLYDTVDRNENRVKVILTGNTIQFYNPYHVHKAFKIPEVAEGSLWCSKNVLFWNPIMSEAMRRDRDNNPFTGMIEDTDFGKYAMNSKYVADNTCFIGERPSDCFEWCILQYNNKSFGVWIDSKRLYAYIDDKYNPNNPRKFALQVEDLNERYILNTATMQNKYLYTICEMYKYGHLRFKNMAIKTDIEKGIQKLL